MSGIGSLIREIDVKFQKCEKQTYLFLLSKTNARILSVNICSLAISLHLH